MYLFAFIYIFIYKIKGKGRPITGHKGPEVGGGGVEV